MRRQSFDINNRRSVSSSFAAAIALIFKMSLFMNFGGGGGGGDRGVRALTIPSSKIMKSTALTMTARQQQQLKQQLGPMFSMPGKMLHNASGNYCNCRFRSIATSLHAKTSDGDDEQRQPEDASSKEESQQLQLELNKLTKEPPMFSAFDADSFDKDALPVPLFTSVIILIGSLIWTYLLFDAGINGI